MIEYPTIYVALAGTDSTQFRTLVSNVAKDNDPLVLSGEVERAMKPPLSKKALDDAVVADGGLGPLGGDTAAAIKVRMPTSLS